MQSEEAACEGAFGGIYNWESVCDGVVLQGIRSIGGARIRQFIH
jgi:hypothetical protein